MVKDKVSDKRKGKYVTIDGELHDWLYNYAKDTGRTMKFILDNQVRSLKSEVEKRSKEVISYGKRK